MPSATGRIQSYFRELRLAEPASWGLGYTLIDNVTARAPLIDRADQPAGPSSTVIPSSRHPQPTIREIFDEHASFVWRTLRHLGVHDADIEDVCQEVFVTVHRKLAGFEWRST